MGSGIKMIRLLWLLAFSIKTVECQSQKELSCSMYPTQQSWFSSCPGEYRPEGKWWCENCPAGTYQPGYGDITECLPCPTGNYCPNQRMSAPIKCPKGTWQSLKGSVSCFDCDAGWYCFKVEQEGRFPCQAGYYCPPKTIDPIPCEKGTYSNDQHFTSCWPCPAGSYMNAPGQLTFISNNPIILLFYLWKRVKNTNNTQRTHY